MNRLTPLTEISDLVEESGGESLSECYQCGLCDAVCPVNRLEKAPPFSMRKLIRQATFGLTEIDKEELWRCTTCGTCPSRCPRGVDQVRGGTALRRVSAEHGVFPGTASPLPAVIGNLGTTGNPLGEEQGKRGDWRAKLPEGVSAPAFSEEAEHLYFTGCYLAFDPRLKKVARATATILNRAGISFGILGEEERCCGESIRKAGDEALFKELARANIKSFIGRGVKKILVSSPHCYHTFANEYPEFMVNFELIHTTQLIAELIESNRLELSGSFDKKIAYHDPCYLGRHNGIYDAPREALAAVPGLELVTMSDEREASLCCGGGGGRIWMETPKAQRLADLRVAQALEAGAEVLVTACPYCISNFEESALSLPEGSALEICDLSEVVASALDGGTK